MKDRKIVVSCTSTAQRLSIFYYTHKSLLNQTQRPDLILLNLSKEPYLKDNGCNELPNWLLDSGIKINFVKNTGSYRKLLPALPYVEENDYLITVDDDVIYSDNLIKNLVNEAQKYPQSIICSRARVARKNFFGNWQNYLRWPISDEEQSGLFLVPIGAGGILYQKSLLDLGFLNNEAFLEIAPTNDDLWFKFSSLRMKTPVVVVPSIEKGTMYLSHGFSLDSYNNARKNDNRLLIIIFTRILLLIKNYFGINQTPNDFAWDKISQFSEIQGKNKVTR